MPGVARASIILGISTFLCSEYAFACKCESAYPVCDEVRHSDRVFTGTVLSVTPALLDPWHRIGPDGARLPAAEIAVLQKDPSPAALAKLRNIYLDLLRDVSEESLKPIRNAATQTELEQAFANITSHGRLVRFHLDKVWKVASDDDNDSSKKKDDDDKKKDDNDARKTDDVIEVWTGVGDCGVPFQKGESWLVYADTDEETGTIETSLCTRTRRLIEAGSDLSYLFHFKETPETSTRIEGFVSTDVADAFIGWSPGPLRAPLGGMTVLLSGEDRKIYATSAADGRYIFDGLPEGKYQISVFASGFPEVFQVTSGPRTVKLDEKSCGREIMIVPK
jgi:hypothetical protein